MTGLVSIPSRAGFLAARNSGIKAVAAGLVLQATPTGRDDWRLGLTASKKTGNAVRRNRARRRTHPKSAMAMSLTLYSRPLTVSMLHIAVGAAIFADVSRCGR